MNEQSNFIVAVVLSLAVLLGWQVLVVEPRMAEEATRKLAQQSFPTETGNSGQDAQTDALSDEMSDIMSDAPAASIAPDTRAPRTTYAAREQKIDPTFTPSFANTPRLNFTNANVQGSIALIGARFDDLLLTGYRETAATDAPQQRVLQRTGRKGTWQARHGFVAPADSPITLPDKNSLWKVVEGAHLTPETPVTLAYTTPEGVELRQLIAMDDAFMFTITQSVINKGAATITLYPFGQISRTGTPETSNLFILHEGGIGFLGEAGLQEIDYGDLLDDGPVKQTATGGWLGITDKYWATALIPPQEAAFTGRFTGKAGATDDDAVFRSDFLLAGVTLETGDAHEMSSQFFAGAKQVDAIDAYSEAGVLRFDLLIDWGWFYFLTKPMFRALQLFFNLLGNYGLSILLVTVLIKLAFFPLANRSYETMAKMKKMQPRLTQIREMHKDDRQAQQQEMMKLYRDEKLNPLAGCLPVLLQIPVFFALYKVLFVTIDMRHTPFFGWIQDLSAPDPTSLFNLFGLLPFDPPLFLMIGVWPLIMGITMFVQMQMNPPPPDPVQARIFQILPLFFTFILASFPAGLVIYWAWNNFLSILQQGLIMRRNDVKIELFANLGFRKKAPAARAPSKDRGGSGDEHG